MSFKMDIRKTTEKYDGGKRDVYILTVNHTDGSQAVAKFSEKALLTFLEIDSNHYKARRECTTCHMAWGTAAIAVIHKNIVSITGDLYESDDEIFDKDQPARDIYGAFTLDQHMRALVALGHHKNI
jgi:hypothetical protein|tara:strand:- start:104 stop:481 length:378 start_codon:yes stop_codon:yes gene_type:complete